METKDLHLPSGSEVESATLHVPVNSGMRGRFDHLKSQAVNVKANVTRSVSRMKSNMNHTATTKLGDMQSSMRSNPMKWAGIAAGTGFGLGLISRVMHWRNKHHPSPTLVVIERTC